MRRERIGVAILGAACVSGVFLAALHAAPAGMGPEGSNCLVARVEQDVVTVGDAEMVRAVIQPPLTRDEAKRLAIAATAAHRRRSPEGPMAKMGARLAAYRRAVREGIATMEGLHVEPGPCWGGRSPDPSVITEE